MLAKILEDMWVEPEVLEALSEEQKRILFLKMREEQVRRWTEREEKEEKQMEKGTRPKKASSKHVRWLLGRDGDVSVRVIGELDEFRSSKLLQNLMTNRLPSDAMNGIQTADMLPGREARQLGFKEEIQPPRTDVHPAPATDQSSEEDVDSCGADDDPKDSNSESGGSADNLGDWVPHYRPHLSSHGNEPPLRAPLSDTERVGAQDGDNGRGEGKQTGQRGRVAQLWNTFTEDLRGTPTPAPRKPPVPAKPAHLQRGRRPLVR